LTIIDKVKVSTTMHDLSNDLVGDEDDTSNVSGDFDGGVNLRGGSCIFYVVVIVLVCSLS
jgi:hypothetical protein